MVIGITNLKGGVGKTIVSQNLAVCLAKQGHSVCLVDTDTNQNSVSWAGLRDESLSEILTVGLTDSKAMTKEVAKLDKKHDFVIIDGTPSLSEMTTRIILASDLLIIPIIAAANDLRALSGFFERYEQALEFRDQIPAYFFLNQFQDFQIQQTVVEALKEYELPILKSKFKNRVAFVEANAIGSGVVEWTDSKAKSEANMFTHEILKISKSLNLLIS